MKNKSAARLRDLKGKKKIQFVWDYYKLHLLLIAVVIYVLGWQVHARLTQKETVLYTAAVNINIGDILQEKLTSDFLARQELDERHYELSLLSNLVLTESDDTTLSQLTYTSQMKILGSIETKQLDVVLMNKEAYDAFSQNGYLADLEETLPASLQDTLQGHLTTNVVILEDNTSDMVFDPDVTYSAVTTEVVNAVDLSDSALLGTSEMDGTVYLGILANTPRLESVLEYLTYMGMTEDFPSSFPYLAS